MDLPRGVKYWITAAHMSFERELNIAVVTFYRKPKGEIMNNFFEPWEIIEQTKFTSDMNAAIKDGVKSLRNRIVTLNAKKAYSYVDEDTGEVKEEPFEGEIEIRVGDDYEKITMEQWTKEVDEWLSSA